MLLLQLTSSIILASALTFAPAQPGKPRAPVIYVKPVPAPALPILSLLAPPVEASPVPEAMVPGYDDSYVRVKGLEGRLVVLPTILAEFQLTVGDEIELDVMYQLLEYNNRKLQ